MKYVLVFFITLSAWSMPIPRINDLTVNSALYDLLKRLNKSCSIIDNEQQYSVSNITCVGGTPDIADLDSELIAYKAELIIEENARLAEIARVRDIRTRLKNLPRRNSMMRKVLNVPNPDAWLRDNIHTMDKDLMEAKIAEIESFIPAVQSEIDDDDTKRTEKKGARNRMKTANCKSLSKQILKDMCRILKRQ